MKVLTPFFLLYRCLAYTTNDGTGDRQVTRYFDNDNRQRRNAH
ncbi:hypothetical protein [Chitinophaga terrae (ex Kim and Jung 2007)]|nr:hypothetical protein [Chitinophaga terrae (ex Kim and Jung 2007)]